MNSWASTTPESLAALTIDGLEHIVTIKALALLTAMASASGLRTERLQAMSYAVSAPRSERRSTRTTYRIFYLLQGQQAEPKASSPLTGRI